ncbi:zinc-finger homeodomain protein 1 [Magnolia sinica]|uniref:zinc-finger homeodomain protein 1 n=1 Tax=Magnolia sinica TaxID=86752 RepID=UPI00265A3EC0|nr:zinc-finger homeodomain protein 1 [Magnolia sinica]
MEFEDQDDQEDEEMELPVSASYDSVPRAKIASSAGGAAATTDGGAAAAATASSRRSGSRYRECLKNHAVSIGGHAVDGCGEFMPAGEEGSMDALKCAACSCHRNFHRKETDGGGGDGLFHHHYPFSPYYRAPAGYLHVVPPHHRPPLALPSTSGGAHSRDDQEDISNPSAGATAAAGGSRKRFRTKFTQEQKDKMLAFAEKLGWRIQKHDEAAVQEFCNDTGVERKVLKVWMHNNKHTLGKKP